MDWLKYIPMVGSAIGGLVDMFGGSSGSPEKPKTQRAVPTFTPLPPSQAQMPMTQGSPMQQQMAPMTPQQGMQEAARMALARSRALRGGLGTGAPMGQQQGGVV